MHDAACYAFAVSCIDDKCAKDIENTNKVKLQKTIAHADLKYRIEVNSLAQRR